jgi:hypothetical protein
LKDISFSEKLEFAVRISELIASIFSVGKFKFALTLSLESRIEFQRFETSC